MKTMKERFATTGVTLKLTATELATLDGLVAQGHYESRSAALRHGMGLVFDFRKVNKDVDSKIEAERRHHWPRRNWSIKRTKKAK